MKKFMILLTALILCFALTATAFADNVISPENNDVEQDENPGGQDTDNSPQTGTSDPVVLVWCVGIASAAVLGSFVYSAAKSKKQTN